VVRGKTPPTTTMGKEKKGGPIAGKIKKGPGCGARGQTKDWSLFVTGKVRIANHLEAMGRTIRFRGKKGDERT